MFIKITKVGEVTKVDSLPENLKSEKINSGIYGEICIHANGIYKRSFSENKEKWEENHRKEVELIKKKIVDINQVAELAIGSMGESKFIIMGDCYLKIPENGKEKVERLMENCGWEKLKKQLLKDGLSYQQIYNQIK